LRIVPDGIYYACACALVGVLGSYFLNPWAGVPFYILSAFCLYFFRDPERTPPPGAVMLAPADGKIVAIRQLSASQTRISIFLNIFNVHVNRAPIPGTVSSVVYQKGKFLVASHEDASTQNEQNTLIVETPAGPVICRQIAGLIARRIICYKKPGDPLSAGERIGYIKFGSRVDVIFGPEWLPAVKVGDKVSAGSTILARPAEPGVTN
jgi:phosphatidylserine decarboxylase